MLLFWGSFCISGARCWVTSGGLDHTKVFQGFFYFVHSILPTTETHNSLIIVQCRRTREEVDRRICSHSAANLLCNKHVKAQMCTRKHAYTHARGKTHIITAMNLAVIKGVWLGILLNSLSIIYETHLNRADLSLGQPYADEATQHSCVFIAGAEKKDVAWGEC